MKREWQIILSGIGGQGLLFSGNLLGESVTRLEDRYAVMTSTYGVETRGTFAKSDVVISDEPIDYPEALEPDIILTLAQVAYDRYVESETGGIIVYDSSTIAPRESSIKQLACPISEIAKASGVPTALNMVALGILVKRFGICDPESIRQAIALSAGGTESSKYRRNVKAFDAGVENAV